MLRLSALRVTMLILSLLPGSFSKIYTTAESLKEGLLVASVLAALLLMLSGQTIRLRWARPLSRRFGLAMLVLALHSLLTLTLSGDGFNLPRLALSMMFLGALFILWLPIAEALFSAKPSDLDGALRWCYWMLLLDGLASTVLYQLNGSKEMFFAGEASHFSLTFLPFLFYMLFRDRSPWHMAVALAIAILISNLTLLIGVVLLSAFYYRHRQMMLVIVFALGVLLIAMIPDFSNYVVGRLTLTPDSENLSALVLLSGYERAYETLAAGHWFGMGFQQLGFVGPSGELLDSISLLTASGNQLNLYDGGTLASKLIVEFGVLGIAVLVLYLVGLGRLFMRCTLMGLTPHVLFYLGIYVTFSCYLFIRGMGYLSPTVFLFLVAQFGVCTGRER